MVLQDTKISEDTQEKLKYLLYAFKDIMSSFSCNTGCTKLIEMDIETEPNLSPEASHPYTLPIKQKGWVAKELKDLEKAEGIQGSPSLYTSPTVIVPRKCPPGSPVQETERLCAS